MFTKYEIKNINSEEVLILHMNYNYEFASQLGDIEHNLTLKEKIKEYIDKMKIHFKGKYIILMIAGIATVTLACNSFQLDQEQDKFIPNPEMVSIIDYKFYDNLPSKEIKLPIFDKEEVSVEDKVSPPQETIKPSEKPNSTESNQKPNVTETKPIPKPSENKPNQNNNNTVQKPTSPNTNQNKPSEKPSNPAEDKKEETYVTIYRSNGTVETLLLEDYLVGVVGSEMPASFGSEALKAQAIVARTYALRRINNGQVLTDTTSTQVYKDNNQLKAMWGNSYNTYYQKVKQAVESTKGLVITYQGKLIDAVFHSTSNGHTVDAKDVWGNEIPYLKSVSSPFDTSASSFLRDTTKEISLIANNLGISITENSQIEIVSRDSNGRVLQVKIDEKLYSGVEFRNKLGLRSTDFDIVINDNMVVFTTKGYGHGVGMSQYGANGMANNGYNYSQIIHHYYTNVDIVKK